MMRWMSVFATGGSLSLVRSVSHVLQGGTRQLSSCKVVVVKPAGGPIALSPIGSLAQELPHWSMTNEDRELQPGIGKCLLMMIWRMTLSPESTFSLRDRTSMQNELACMDTAKVESLHRSLLFMLLPKSHSS